MLDANAVILLLAGHDQLTRHASQTFEDDLCMSSIAYAEVNRGIAAGKPASILLADAIKAIPVLPFDQAAADAYAMLPFRRHRRSGATASTG
jgi:tRNA(fMet)-specific endonuclease VapC